MTFPFHFDSHCPAEDNSSLSLFSAAALFMSLALNAAKSSIPFGRIKRHPKAWWSAEVEEVVSERRKAFAAAHRSDDRSLTSPLTDVLRQSSPRPKWRHGRRLALFSRPNLTLNLYALFFALSLTPLPPLLTSPNTLLPGNRLWSLPIS